MDDEKLWCRYVGGGADQIRGGNPGNCCTELCGEIHSLAALLPRYGPCFKRKDIPANGIYLFYEK